MVPEEPVGARIAKRRHVLGLSQEELAERVGVARDTVSMWERGRQFPHRHLGKVEEVLGISLTPASAHPPPPVDIRERALWDLAVQDMPESQAWELVEEFRRRKRRTA